MNKDIKQVDLKTTLEDSYRNYAGYTIMERAIVDARDCLKPSQRMVMYSQFIDKILPTKPHQKSMKSIASGLAHFYTHGDVPLYGLLARMGKPWATRYLLEDFQGNTGTIEEGNNQAAPRYTQMRLSPLAATIFESIEKETIDKWFNNYDDTEQYPSVLPSKGYYNICNGSIGIATGLSSSIPQFNLIEVNEALVKLLWNPDAAFEDIMCLPDFATGAQLLNRAEVMESLRVGTGKSCKLRSVIEYVPKEKALIVTQIPYSVYTGTIRKQLLEIIENEEENPGIERFLDLSGVKPLIKIYLKKSANPTKVLKELYKRTSLQSFYSINMTMLDEGKRPRVFGWKDALQAHIDHEKIIYRKDFEYDINKINDRLHIIAGLLIALARIDEVIKVIKESESTSKANDNLQKAFLLSPIQAKAILDIRLARLAKLEVKKLEDEKEDLLKQALRIETILKDDTLFKKEIEKGFVEIAKKFGDERRTIILDIEKEEDEPIEIKSLILSLTNKGNLLVLEDSSLYSQKRKTVGNKFKLLEDEFISSSVSLTSQDNVFFFTREGDYLSMPADTFQVGSKTSLAEKFGLEKVKLMTAFPSGKEEIHLIFVTKNGLVKKSRLGDYSLRKTKTKALTLNPDDSIRYVALEEDNYLGILSEKGSFLMIDTREINPVGRTAKGVLGMKLENDKVAAAQFVPKGVEEIVFISKSGIGKRVAIDEFRVCGRNSRGVNAQRLKEKDLMAGFAPLKKKSEIVIVSSHSLLKISKNEIPLQRRNTIGSSLIDEKENFVVEILETANSTD